MIVTEALVGQCMSSMVLNVDLTDTVSTPSKATADAVQIRWLRMLLASLSGTTGCWVPADNQQLSNSYRSAFAAPIADLDSGSIVVQKQHPGAWSQLVDRAEENSSMMTSRALQSDADELLSAGRQGTGRGRHGNPRRAGVRRHVACVGHEVPELSHVAIYLSSDRPDRLDEPNGPAGPVITGQLDCTGVGWPVTSAVTEAVFGAAPMSGPGQARRGGSKR